MPEVDNTKRVERLKARIKRIEFCIERATDETQLANLRNELELRTAELDYRKRLLDASQT